MSRHRIVSRRGYHAWMIVNAALLLLMSGGVLYYSVGTKFHDAQVSALTARTPDPSASAALARRLPTRRQVLSAKGMYFGLSTPQAPWSATEIDGIADKAGARPSMVEYFVNWTENFRPRAVLASYRQGMVPVITWEPWAGLQHGTSQPAYALAHIIDGRFDDYITRFARGIRKVGAPVVLRFGHEMNGTWYPWAETKSGNRPGEYVRAWRHVYRIFDTVGAHNTIWVWSPNIIRPVPHTSLRELYPGDAYVDWVGMVGYAADEETTAAQTYGPTLKRLRTFTHKPVLITETGAGPGPNQARWTADLFRWLASRHDIVGFIWFEYNKESTGTKDWRFTVVPDTLAAFRSGIDRIRIARPVRS